VIAPKRVPRLRPRAFQRCRQESTRPRDDEMLTAVPTTGPRRLEAIPGELATARRKSRRQNHVRIRVAAP
jgi:hypothetical protein